MEEVGQHITLGFNSTNSQKAIRFYFRLIKEFDYSADRFTKRIEIVPKIWTKIGTIERELFISNASNYYQQ